MFNSSKVVGRLSQITRHLRAINLYQRINNGVISCSNIRYSSKSSDQKPPSLLKSEQCIPQTKSIPPSAPDDTSPPNCNEENNKSKPKPNWKQLLAALIITGLTIYVASTLEWFGSKQKSKSKLIHSNESSLLHLLNSLEKEDEEGPKGSKKRVKNPPISSSIPQKVPYLLIGGGTAAFSAFRAIKSTDPRAKVLVVTEEDFPYMRPPLSKELWFNTDTNVSTELKFKQWNGLQRSLFYEPREFYSDINTFMESEKGGVALATGWKIVKIDAMKKIAILEDGYEINYDKCLISSGATPKVLPLFELAEDEVKEKLTTFRTKEDFLDLERKVNRPNVKNVVIIGGGFLGSELACSLARNLDESKNIYQIYKEKYIMSQVLPEYLSEWTTNKVKAEGIHCISNTEVKDFLFKNKELTLVLTEDQTIKADQIILAVGVEANTELAGSSQLETHPEIGGFIVNAELQARNDIWVAGDAACFYDVQLGRRRVEHHDHAVISGRLAGENMTGAGKPYLHQSMFWSDLGPEIGYEAVGITDSSLKTIGVFAQSTKTNDGTTERESEKETVDKPTKDVIIKSDTEPSDYGKGVIFYLRDNVIIGIVLWNLFNRMSIARQVLATGKKYDDLNEVAKLFSIHED